jgi:hypothetical protein
MPDSNLPRWARILGRYLRGAAYALAVVLAAADVWLTSPVIASVPRGQVVTVASVTAVMGALGLVSVAAHRWRCEWVAASFVAFGLAGRAWPVWWSIGDDPVRLAAAAGMTIAAIGIGLRSLDLWVFATKTRDAAHRARKHRRRS